MGLHKNKANLEGKTRKQSNNEDNYNKNIKVCLLILLSNYNHTMMQSANIEHAHDLRQWFKKFRERVGRKDRGVHTVPFMVYGKQPCQVYLLKQGL